MTTTTTTTCGICNTRVAGGIRDLNRHKADKHPAERDAMRAKRKARVARRGVSMNHCQSCTKFVSLEPGEPEDNGIDTDEEGNISGSVRLSLVCADCGQDMAESEVTLEDNVEVEHKDGCTSSDLSLDDLTVSMEDEGGGRFSRHLYYLEASFTVRCATCGAEAEETLTSEKVAASSFDSCQ
mgnify:FL=1